MNEITFNTQKVRILRKNRRNVNVNVIKTQKNAIDSIKRV